VIGRASTERNAIALVDLCPVAATAPDNQVAAPLSRELIESSPASHGADLFLDGPTRVIATAVTVDQVVAGVSIQTVVSATAVEAIPARAPADDVVAIERANRVVTAQAADEVLLRCPDQTIVAGGPPNRAASPDESLRWRPGLPESGCSAVTGTAA
jgi:hypothetical protein